MDKFEIEGEEVIERDVKATGNGAHAYLPKDWLDDTVKVVRLPQGGDPGVNECDICKRGAKNTIEWCWIDDSGGAYFQICSDCRSKVEKGPEGVCAICRKDRERSKSAGFGPMGADTDHYAGCDTCRERVLSGGSPSAQPAWIE